MFRMSIFLDTLPSMSVEGEAFPEKYAGKFLLHISRGTHRTYNQHQLSLLFIQLVTSGLFLGGLNVRAHLFRI